MPVQASAFAEHEECDLAGAPSSSTWAWHFVLPGGEPTARSSTPPPTTP
ncbi:MAG TPA: hypothetical protein VF519_06990 [Mycobacteriales bacterium]